VRRVLIIQTTTHDPAVSTSWAMGWEAAKWIKKYDPSADIRVIDANKLHIVENLSCYANGGRHCADSKAGPFRCWAHVSSLEDPAKYGGVDEMPVIYDGLKWADTVVFATSARWGSHSALCQKIIERMNTLENRGSFWKEGFPMAGKRLGVIVGGLNWKTSVISKHLMETFRWWQFEVDPDASLVWQFTRDVFYEQTAAIKPNVQAWLASPEGSMALTRFTRSLLGAA